LRQRYFRPCSPGMGSNRATREELLERLETATPVSPSRIRPGEALVRLEDCGHIVRAQKQGHPVVIAWSGTHPLDRADVLARELCATIKRRSDQFESDEQLRSWLDEDQITYTPEGLAAVIGYLEWIGRVRRLRQDQWNVPLPGWYVEPRIHNE
jgi:hypothetical protein